MERDANTSKLILSLEREIVPYSGEFETRPLRSTVLLNREGVEKKVLPGGFFVPVRDIRPKFLVATFLSTYDRQNLNQPLGLNAYLEFDVPNIDRRVIFTHFANREGDEAVFVNDPKAKYQGEVFRGLLPGQRHYYELGENLDKKIVRVCFENLKTNR